MDEQYDRIAALAAESQDKSTQLLERLMEVAQPKAVYSEPLVKGEYTLINAAEVSTGIGFSYGIGAGEGTRKSSGRDSFAGRPVEVTTSSPRAKR